MAIKKDKTIIFLVVIILFILLYGPMYLAAALTKTCDWKSFIITPSVLIKVLSDFNKLKVFFCFIGLEIAAYLYLGLNRKNNRVDMVEVTPDIHIPAPAGQGQYGTARFMKENELDKYYGSIVIDKTVIKHPERLVEKQNLQNVNAGFVIGKKDVKDGEKIYFVNDDMHTLVLGASGSGKSRCHVMQTIGLIGLCGESIVCTDIKGELSDYTEPYLKSLGYDVQIINFNDPSRSSKWNLLQPIIDYVDEGKISLAVEAAWDLVNQLVGDSDSDPIWSNGEKSVIIASVMAVVCDNTAPGNRKYQNLANVYYFIINMCKQEGNVLPLSVYEKTLPDSHPAKGLLGISNVAPSKTRGSFYTSAVTTLEMFTNPSTADMTSSSDFRIEDLGNKKMALFIVLPDDRATYNTLAAHFCKQIYTLLSKEADRNGGTLNNRVHNLYDEFGNFAAIDDINSMLTVSRSKGILYHLFLQSYEQLDKVYDSDTSKIIRGNCRVSVYLNSEGNDTKKEFSDSLGKYTTTSISTSTNENSSATAITSNGSSRQLIERPLLFPNDLDRVDRPYSLIKMGKYPLVMTSPDLGKWYFNKAFGMGDRKHNQRLRMKRREDRVQREIPNEIELWGIWKPIINTIHSKQKERMLADGNEGGLEQEFEKEQRR